VPGALDGILVVDLSRILAGPYCTMTLGDLGARVIKIENPDGGDPTRSWGPPFVNGESAYFLAVNRNKESVTLNLKNGDDAAILRKLIEKADVLVENFRPGTMTRLGFSYEACAALNSRLIYASISGYGQTGPESSRPGYDLIAQSEGGVMSLTGSPDGPPFKSGVSQADITAGLWALSGILAALYAREKTGRGQRIDIALVDCQISLLAYHVTNYFATGQIPNRMENRHPTITPYEMYAASDGYVTVAVGTEHQWKRFCVVLEMEDLVLDARFRTNSDRIAHREELEAILVPRLAQRSVSDWLERFGAAGIPAGTVKNVAEVLESEQARARGMMVEVEHRVAGRLRFTGSPVKLSETPAVVRRAPPGLGDDNIAAAREFLGMGES
jgi:CoA:oxalate CoA-transferase